MSKLLEIFGKGVTVNTADLIWHWLNTVHKAGEDPSDLKANEFDAIIELIGQLKLDQAEEKLKFYQFENPTCAMGRLAMTAVYLHRNDIANAIKELDILNKSQPSNTIALYSLGYCYERCGQVDKAMEFYQDCLKFKSFLQLPRQRLAAIYFKNGRVDKTIKEYETLITEHPEDITSKIILGYLYIAEHDYLKAIEAFNMAILSHPDNFHDENERAEEEVLAGDQLHDAVDRLEEMIEQVGAQPDLYVRMADLHEKMGNSAEAQLCYESAIRIEPNYLEATIKLGTHYLRCHQAWLAAEQFNRAIEINDEIVDSYIGLTIAEALCGKKLGAYKTLSLASAIEQNSVMLFSETSTLHLQISINNELENENDDQKIAISTNDVISAHAQECLKKPRNADVHYKYGILMMVVNEMDEAIKSFKAALAINPTHFRAKCKLAICLFEAGKNQQALDMITNTKAPDVSTLKLHYKTSMLFCDKQKFKSALMKIENSFKSNYAGEDVLGNVEVVLENIGVVDRAMSTWDRLTETARTAISERFLS